jgi:hypothetical protein
VIIYDLWDALDARGVNIFEQWTRKLGNAHRARLNQKLDMIQRFDTNLMLASGVLNGPIKKTGHILKLRAQSNVAMRPLLCRGPLDTNREYTLLLGAFEVGGVLSMSDIRKAQDNRAAILNDPKGRRTKHVRVP